MPNVINGPQCPFAEAKLSPATRQQSFLAAASAATVSCDVIYQVEEPESGACWCLSWVSGAGRDLLRIVRLILSCVSDASDTAAATDLHVQLISGACVISISKIGADE